MVLFEVMQCCEARHKKNVAIHLLGAREDIMRHIHRVEQWGAAVLYGLVTNVGPFTDLVAPSIESLERHATDLILKTFIA